YPGVSSQAYTEASKPPTSPRHAVRAELSRELTGSRELLDHSLDHRKRSSTSIPSTSTIFVSTKLIEPQVVLPLVQGMLWTLVVSGWRNWNRGAQFQGSSLGSKVRRWWWDVNNWKIPEKTQEKVSEKVGEFYTAQLGGHD
ncbi:MAG: hypothetical protein Q9226_004346, partial [Calogaya cf. arnoldii]